ncbi:sensor histidine kinase [Aquabacterium sp.]|uniref:sensor histidine kinase n=1 Tax=Aquabacterium sp. TaxID=1872578 RepID=UPI002BFE0429|nr:ATP-binding protein [Aquabacterium sp.]HSW04243.1 ATP-binding protein [Aquabacterium sp.]
MRRGLAGALVLLLIASAAFGAYRSSRQTGLAQIDDTALRQLDLYAATLESEIARHAYLPGLLEVDRDIQLLFAGQRQPADLRAASRKLAGVNVMAGSMAVFLLDAGGDVLASSDAYRGDTANAPRAAPLFLAQVLKEGRTGFFAVDMPTAAAGYCFAQPVMRNTELLGFIGVRISLDPLESSWIDMGVRSESEEVLVIDENGVIIMSSVPQWKYRTLAPVASTRRASLEASERYPPQTLLPLGMREEQTTERGARLVRLTGWKDMASPDTLRLTQERPLAQFGWRLMLVSDPTEAARTATRAAWGGGAIAAFVALLALYLGQRRRALLQQQRARQALQQANDALESTVAERTHELRDANQKLVGEMQERQRAEQELVQAGKLAVLGQMSVGISHEINQPVTALRALATNAVILLKRGSMEEAIDNLKAILDVAARLNRITTQLKVFARKSPASPAAHEPVSLHAAVANVCRLLEHRTSAEQVQVQIDVADNSWVQCEIHRLEQVLINLATNAMDAMAEVAVKVLAISARPCEGRLCVRVADTGPPVPDEVLQHLFEPFYSTKPTGEGLGLGLIISSTLVREFGGQLRVEAAESGLAFEFDLPLSKGTGNRGTGDV